MAEFDINKSDTIGSTIEDYEVGALNTDGISDNKETEYQNPNFTKYFGYYKSIPELKRAIDMKSMWVVGKGWTADSRATAILENVTGWGVDTFNTILENMIVVMQVNGDSFAEIIRNERGEVLNLKPLDPASVKVISNRKGVIQRYEQTTKVGNSKIKKKFKTEEIFHLSYQRVADEIHGTSIIEACQWVIDALNEAMEDQRKVMHRNVAPVKIWKVDTDDQTKIDNFKEIVKESNKDFENIIIPKDVVETEILSIPSNATLNILPWIQYLKSFFYQIVGVSEIQVGGTPVGTESSSKISFLSSEQAVLSMQRYVSNQVWAQLAIRIELNKTASLETPLKADEAKDGAQGQMNFQPNETTGGIGR